jgi:hypothetical protein
MLGKFLEKRGRGLENKMAPMSQPTGYLGLFQRKLQGRNDRESGDVLNQNILGWILVLENQE